MTQQVSETTTLAEATVVTAAQAASGRLLVQIITPGLGSSGYYSPQVLEAAARDRLVTRGTAMFLDHASAQERQDRPERSVRDIAGYFTEDARWTGQALVAEAQILPQHREHLVALAEHIGVSISGSATDIVERDVDGQRVPVIEGLAEIGSVDFVTRAGRGGRIAAVLESARERVIAEVHQALDPNAPVPPAGSTTESQGGTMPEIEEARLRQLETDAGRVTVLESERDTAVRERDALARALAESNARNAATGRARAALVEAALPAPTVERVIATALGQVSLTDAGQLDEAAFDTALTAARTAEEAYIASLTEAGTGRVRGVGHTETTEVGEADVAKILATAFGRTVKEV